MGDVLSVNVGRVGALYAGGERLTTAIVKRPVSGRVALEADALAGDEVGDPSVHGGPIQAAYAYAREDYAWWEPQIGLAYEPGLFGENLTTQGVDVSGALVGERWKIGTAIVEITSPRIPCVKLAARMNDPRFVKRFAAALRPGAYCAIVRAGDVGAGDPIEIVFRPSHALTIREMARIWLFDRDRADELLVPELRDEWRAKVLATRA